MTPVIVFAACALCAVMAVALHRERRLRLALQLLLFNLSRRWRTQHGDDSDESDFAADARDRGDGGL